MMHFDTEIGNIATILFVTAVLIGSEIVRRYRAHSPESTLIIYGWQLMAVGVLIGSAWWVFAHHGTPTNPGDETLWHMYKGYMRVVSASFYGFGTLCFFKAYHKLTRVMAFAGFISAFAAGYLVSTFF